jgi:phosphatidylethanolamine-binding protein (PEBP) family uncharacterized protein
MDRIRIDDLPVAENLTPEQEALIIGAGLKSFRPCLEALEDRWLPAPLIDGVPHIDLHNGTLTLTGHMVHATNHATVSYKDGAVVAQVNMAKATIKDPNLVQRIVYVGNDSTADKFTNNTILPSQFVNLQTSDTHNTPHESPFKITGPYKLPDYSASGQTAVKGVQVGTNTPPPITWEGVPSDTRTFTLTMKDIDVPENPGGQYTHMVLTDIPAWVRSVQDAVTYGTPGVNGSRYYGPNPPEMPEGKVHRYVFSLTALGENGTVLGHTEFQSTFAYAQGAQTDTGWIAPNR